MSGVARAYRMGAEGERATIVAWLRKVGYARDDRADAEWAECLLEAADFIERGEHRNIDGEKEHGTITPTGALGSRDP